MKYVLIIFLSIFISCKVSSDDAFYKAYITNIDNFIVKNKKDKKLLIYIKNNHIVELKSTLKKDNFSNIKFKYYSSQIDSLTFKLDSLLFVK